jgi:hypothetical protein
VKAASAPEQTAAPVKPSSAPERSAAAVKAAPAPLGGVTLFEGVFLDCAFLDDLDLDVSFLVPSRGRRRRLV